MLIAWGWRNPHLVYINCSLRSQIGILWVVEAISRASLELKAACWGPNSFATADVWKMPGRHKTHQICLHASCTCDHFWNSTYFWSSDFRDCLFNIQFSPFDICLTLCHYDPENFDFVMDRNQIWLRTGLKRKMCSIFSSLYHVIILSAYYALSLTMSQFSNHKWNKKFKISQWHAAIWHCNCKWWR